LCSGFSVMECQAIAKNWNENLILIGEMNDE
jgi:hypothetical protein